MKKWLKDKWGWLKTFNNPPTVVINMGCVTQLQDEDKDMFVVRGRVIVEANIETLELRDKDGNRP